MSAKDKARMGPPSPWEVLGVERGAGDAEIRQAYLEQVKRHAPDRDPEGFERVRDAYERIRDPLRRALWALEECDPWRPLAELVAGAAPGRQPRFVGPKPWLAALAKR